MSFICKPHPDGALIAFQQHGLLGRKEIPFSDWRKMGAERAPTIRFIEHALADRLVTLEGNAVMASSEWIVSLPGSQLAPLNIPALAGLSVKLSMRGRIDSTDSLLQVVWQDQNLRVIIPEIKGPFIRIAGEWKRLSKSLYEINAATRGFNLSAGGDFEVRLPHWHRVQAALQATTGHELDADKFVGALTIYQAGAFSLDVRETTAGPDYIPILMARGLSPEFVEIDDGTDAPESSGESSNGGSSSGVNDYDGETGLLTPILQTRFNDEVSNRAGATKPAYVLDRNTYLLIDPALRVALDVVKKSRGASESERKEFLRNPRTRISAALGDGGDAIVAGLFVETIQYSDRVEGLALWEKPKLPWITKRANQWLPEKFTVRIGQKSLEATPEKIEELSVLCGLAEEERSSDFAFEKEQFATIDVRRMLSQLEVAEPAGVDTVAPTIGNQALSDDKDVLQIKQNLEDLDYASTLVRRSNFIPFDFPKERISQTVPKEHQLAGFNWLCKSWSMGWPGVLLADDMGLGKSFQALAFLVWIRGNQLARRGPYKTKYGPVLIVAPTALLDNWAKEAAIHLRPNALGDCVEAFGANLKHLKTSRQENWTPEDALDVEQLRRADWILTTYETLALYHRSFARVPYSIGIFDEMQKIKSPDSINSHTAKTMNINFVLGMTGTPIENRLEDLWCLMDRVAPGYLGDLKTFSKFYGEEDPSTLIDLKKKMDNPQGSAPPVMLRRMKTDVAKDLPRKEIRSYNVIMPAVQAAAYDNAVAMAKAGKTSRKSMLETLHLLRGISLHPFRSDDSNAYDAIWRSEWINGSARVQKTFSILEELRVRGEKAIVFLEDRALQRVFSASAAEQFALPVRPSIINGEMAGRQRQHVVDRFQAAPQGFDMLILSPKAAGIGLTITAATHVIHLSRWWNPAVEDQCNDRAFRIGQTKDVTVHLPIAMHPVFREASFDVKLNDLLERKRSLSRDMLAPPTSERDIDCLFGETVF